MPIRPWSITALEERRQASRRLSDLPLAWIAVAMGCGIALERTRWAQATNPLWLFLLACVALGFWLKTFCLRNNETGSDRAVNDRARNARLSNKHFAPFLLLTSVVCLAASWSNSSWQWFPSDEVGRYATFDAEPVCLEGIVLSEPIIYRAEPRTPFHAIPPSDRAVFQFKVTRIRNGTTWEPASGQCEVRFDGNATSDPNQLFEVGSPAQLFGQLRRPSPAMNPGQRDAEQASRAKRRLAIVWCESPACISSLSSPAAGNTTPSLTQTLQQNLQLIINQLRQGAKACLTNSLSAVNLPLASAMLLGEVSQLPPETTDAFRRTGTLHVLVVSGLHVGMVAGLPLLLGWLGILPMRLAQSLSLFLVVVYVAMVGARPPALRAAILVGGTVTAALAKRQPIGINSLAGAAIALFIVSPGAFAAAGTKLSFLATATLIGVGTLIADRQSRPQPPLERLINRSRSAPYRSFRKTLQWCGLLLLVTAAVLIVTGPFIAAEFHLISPAALLLAIPVMISLMVIVPSGLLLMLLNVSCGWLPDAWLATLNWLPSQACDYSIGFLRECVLQTANVSFSSFYTPGPAYWWVCLWFLFLAVTALLLTYRPEQRAVPLRLGLTLLAVGFVPTLQNYFSPPQLRVSAIAVGHGLSMLIETPNGKKILYDAGALGSPGRATEIISRALWSRGISQLDAVLLSHADVDHYNALPGLLDRFTVHEVWTTRVMFDSWEEGVQTTGPDCLRQMLSERSIPIHEMSLGKVLNIGQVQLEVLHPSYLGVIGSDNANSLVLGIEYLGKRLLLTGDLESPGLDQLLASEPYPCDLLVAPHHGSIRSEPEKLIEWCSPQQVLISSGDAHPETKARYAKSGAQLLNTYRVGMITCKIDSKGVHWSAFQANQ